MKPSLLDLLPAFKYQNFAKAFLFSTVAMGGQVKAQVFDFYVAESAASNKATTLLNYQYDTTSGTATFLGSYAPSGVFGVPGPGKGTAAATQGVLQYSGNGNVLSYSGFTTTQTANVAFNPSTKTFNSPNLISDASVRSNFTQDGTSFYVAGIPGSINGVGYVAPSGTSASTISTTSYSANTLTFNGASNNLYFSRASGTAAAIYTPTTNGSGLVTTATAFSPLTGTGWNGTHAYNGLDFIGTDTLFVADSTANAISIFSSVDPTKTNNWNLKLTLTLSSTQPIQQLSVTQLDSDDSLVFFTTNGLTGTSTFNTVAYNTTTGFGTVQVLGNSTSQYYTGIASVNVVPEPESYAMMGLGLLALAFMTFRKKAGQDVLPG